MKRQILIYGLGGVAVLGVALATIPFLTSLGPNDRSRSNLLPVDISHLKVGDVSTLDRHDKRLYVVHAAPDQFVVLAVPTKDGAVIMPDEKWWRPHRPCSNFGPDHQAGGDALMIRFTCRDADPTEWPGKSWVWDGTGRYVGAPGYPMEDMPRIRFERTQTQLLLRTS